jgi:hypothetical protein
MAHLIISGKHVSNAKDGNMKTGNFIENVIFK